MISVYRSGESPRSESSVSFVDPGRARVGYHRDNGMSDKQNCNKKKRLGCPNFEHRARRRVRRTLTYASFNAKVYLFNPNVFCASRALAGRYTSVPPGHAPRPAPRSASNRFMHYAGLTSNDLTASSCG